MNSTNISNAIKIKLEYVSLRIAHGMDRCANPPRSGPQGMPSSSGEADGARRSATGTMNGATGVVVNGGGEAHEEDDGGVEWEMSLFCGCRGGGERKGGGARGGRPWAW